MKASEMKCQLCGKNMFEILGYLERVNAKGGDPIWECRPQPCGKAGKEHPVVEAILGPETPSDAELDALVANMRLSCDKESRDCADAIQSLRQQVRATMSRMEAAERRVRELECWEAEAKLARSELTEFWHHLEESERQLDALTGVALRVLRHSDGN